MGVWGMSGHVGVRREFRKRGEGWWDGNCGYSDVRPF